MDNIVYQSPSMNQGELGTVVGTAKLILEKFLQGVNDMLPAVVISYDRTSNRAKVQPLISIVTTKNQRVQRAPVASVPVLTLGGNGFVISCPLKAGDLGWIKANDRDISFFKKSYKNSPPNTRRKHSFEDAMFIPDIMLHGVTIAAEDVDNLVIQNSAGTAKMAWWSTFLKITGRLGIGGNPNANALFDVQSTTKASMPFPRMTTSQRNAIPSPAEGMCVWLTDTHGVSSYNGSVWS